MRIGVPKEIKDNENRIAMTPAGVEALTGDGHEVMVQAGGGLGSGIADREFEKAGARMVKKAADIWSSAEMIVKVKEPLPDEYGLIRKGQLRYTFFHFAGSRERSGAMRESGAGSSRGAAPTCCAPSRRGGSRS